MAPSPLLYEFISCLLNHYWHGMMDSLKTQAALEFMVTYGWALVIIAIVAGMFLYFLSLPQTLVPPGCSFPYGITCKGMIIGSNTMAANSINFVIINSQQYDLVGPTYGTLNISGYGIANAVCVPANVVAGGTSLCSASLGKQIPVSSEVRGTITFISSICLLGNANNCQSSRQEEYAGNFSGYAGGVSSNLQVNVMLYEAANTVNAGTPVLFTAHVDILGAPSGSASVSFTTNSPSYSTMTPPDSVTGSNGNATSYFSASAGGSYTVTASFAGQSASNEIYVNAPSTSASTTSTAQTTIPPPVCYGLTLSGIGTQTASVPSSGGCPANEYSSGTSVSITATPPSGYVFASWSGSGTGSYTGSANPATITMDSAITETAQYAQSVPIVLENAAFPFNSVAITLANSQSAATPSPFQQMITIDSSTYSQYINAQWTNVEFTLNAPANEGGTQLQAWVESGATNSATSTIVWVNLPNGIAGGGSTTIYMNFMPYNVMSASGPTGEAPQITSGNGGVYGAYDNGAKVFNFYDNFAGTSLNTSKWGIGNNGAPTGTYTVNSGLTTATSATTAINIASLNNVLSYGPSGEIAEWYSGPFTTSAPGTSQFQFGNAPDGETLWLGTSGSVVLQYQTSSTTGTNTGSTSIADASGNHIYGIYANGANVVALFDYSAVITQSDTYYPTGIQFSAFLNYETGLTSPTLYWIRTRAYPPSGVMPTASFGSVQSGSLAIATPAPFQQMITIDSSTYSQYINAQWTNVEFTTSPGATGSVLQAWVESGATNSATSTIVWVNLPNGIAGGGSTTIYMNFMPYNVMSASGPTGEAPQLSSTYAQYDNGAKVFNFYDNFAGTSLNTSKWISYESGVAINVNNDITFTGPSTCTPDYGGISTVSGTSAPTIFEADFISLSGQSGCSPDTIAETIGNTASSDGYAFNSWSSSVADGSAEFGEGGQTSPALTVSTGIMGFVWINTGNYYALKNYIAYQGTSTIIPISPTIYGALGQWSYAGGTTVIQWARKRAYPPNGVMPTATVG